MSCGDLLSQTAMLAASSFFDITVFSGDELLVVEPSGVAAVVQKCLSAGDSVPTGWKPQHALSPPLGP